ncbi:MAG: TIGR02281 family clan AA aspartic protease [Methylobacteriaceae bacterium]|nr:TIGR02281 family clan AA aspartic protease [Methylobacteriaceae bacterium]
MSFALKLACVLCVVAFAAAGLMPRIAARLSTNHAAPAASAGPSKTTAPTHVAAAAPSKAPEPAAAPQPKAAVPTVSSHDSDNFGFRRVDLPAGPGGHFRANVEIDGRTIPMLVDTGASYVALSAEDADRLGVITRPSDFTITMYTANGRAKAAPVRLHALHIDNLSIYDVDAIVAQPGAMRGSLLGMSFLRRLTRFEAQPDRLRLIQ